MSNEPPDQETIEHDLKSYFEITTSTASGLAAAQKTSAHDYHHEASLIGKVKAGIGLLVVVAVTVAAIGLRGTGSHAPATIPIPAIASGAAVAYDPGIHQVVMFGGVGSDGHVSSATWAWDGSNWNKLSPAASPPARQGASLGWDPSGRQLVMTGGQGDTKSTTFSCPPPAGGETGGIVSGGVIGGPASDPGPVTINPGNPGSSSGSASGAAVISGSAAGGTVVNGSDASGSDQITTQGSGLVTSGSVPAGTNAQCSTVSSTPLSDTWTFDGTTWNQQHPATNPFATGVGRTWLATDTASQTLVMVAESMSLQPAIATTRCLAPATSPASTTTSGCLALPDQTSNVFAWKSGNWVAHGTLAGNISAVATDPSTGNVAAIFSPLLGFSCGAVASSNGSTRATAIAMPCIASGASTTAVPQPTTKVEELQLDASATATWKTMSTTGAPTVPILLATDTAQYLLVVSSEGQTWSFANNVWTELSKSGPPPAALGSAVLTNYPTADTASSRALMFITAPGLATTSFGGGAAPLIPEQPKAATSDATWTWTSTWKQISGGVWPSMAPGPICTGPQPLVAASPSAQIRICSGTTQTQPGPIN